MLTAKSLADGQLPSSKTTLFTAPASTQELAITCHVVNTDSSARTINLYIKRSGSSSRRFIPKDMSMAAGDALSIQLEDGIRLSAGDIIEGDASAASVVDYTFMGVERAA